MSVSLKPVEWVGSSLEDLKEFPEDVRQAVGYALYIEARLKRAKEHYSQNYNKQQGE
jgi:phage-related protein